MSRVGRRSTSNGTSKWMCFLDTFLEEAGRPVIFDLYGVGMNITTKSRRCLFPENENHLKSRAIPWHIDSHRCTERSGFVSAEDLSIGSSTWKSTPCVRSTTKHPETSLQTAKCIISLWVGKAAFAPSLDSADMAARRHAWGRKTATCTRKSIAGWEVLKGGTPRIVINGPL